MSNSKRRTFSAERKTHIVSLVLEQGRDKKDVCREFDLEVALLNRWIKQYQTNGSFTTPVYTPPSQEEYFKLCEELRQAKEELRILKYIESKFGRK